jgi:hypothetical protein
VDGLDAEQGRHENVGTLGPDRGDDWTRDVDGPSRHPFAHDRARRHDIAIGRRHRVPYRATERRAEIQLGWKDLSLHLQAGQGSFDRTVTEHGQFMSSVSESRSGGDERLEVTTSSGARYYEDPMHHDER